MILLLSLAALSATPPQSVAFGAGATTCEAALTPDRYVSSYAWVMGYISGLNSATGAQVGQSTDGDGIMLDVRRACEVKPSAPLIEIAEDDYLKMQEDGR